MKREYEVEAIVNHQHQGRQRQLQYLIKWKGYPSSDNTWEAAQDVHTEDLVRGGIIDVILWSRLDTKPAKGQKKLNSCPSFLSLSPPHPLKKVASWLLHSTALPIKPSPKSPPTLKVIKRQNSLPLLSCYGLKKSIVIANKNKGLNPQSKGF